MTDRDDRVAALALALADGTPVDWVAVESTAASDSERRQIRDLRLVGCFGSTTEPAASLEPVPETWGPLRIIGRIASGRFGDVYRAWDPRLDREVALKLLKGADSDAADRRGAIEEGRLLAKVRHPNVLAVYGAERIDGRVGMWMEFVNGLTLEQIVAENPLPPIEAAAVVAAVADALESVHAAGLVHRDVKTQNVMRDTSGRVVLMDFGAGQVLDAATDPELAGTPLYLAPEVLSGEPASRQSDVYSAGVLLYRLLTGDFPVKGWTVGDVRAAHRRGDVARACAALTDIPAELRDVIEGALAPDPQLRISTASELSARLQAIHESARTAPGPAARSRRVHRMLMAAGIVVTVAVLWMVGGMPSAVGSVSRDIDLAAPRAICDDCGMLYQPALDSEGRRMVFVDSRSLDLVVREVETGRTTAMRVNARGGTPLPMLPVLSPDGEHVAFMWVSDDVFELRMASVETGHVRVLVANPELGVVPLAWSHDGRAVLGQVQRSPGDTDFAWISVPGGAITVIGGPPTHQDERVAANVSPDGRWVALSSAPQMGGGRPRPTSRPIFVMSATGGSPLRVSVSDALESDPVWSADGTRLYFKSDVAGTPDLWSVPMKDGGPTGAPMLVRRDVGVSVPLRMSASGRLFFYERQEGLPESSIATLSPSDRRSTVLERLLGSGPAWSPDGKSIAVIRRASRNGETQTIVVRTLATGEERVYRRTGLRGDPPLWFSDSKGLLARVAEDAKEYWYRIDLEHGDFIRLIENRGRPDFWTHKDVKALGPDGKVLYFGAYADASAGSRISRIVAANLETGEYREVLRLPGSASELPQGAPDLALAVHPDGSQLAIQSVNRSTRLSTVSIVSSDGRGFRQMCAPFPAPGRVDYRFRWTADGRFLLFTTAAPAGKPNDPPSFRVMRLPMSGGEPEFTGFQSDGWMYSFDTNPDGSGIVFNGLATAGARDGVWAIDLPVR